MTQANESSTHLTLPEIEQLACAALRAHRTSDLNARCMARSIAAAEADGIRSHGLLRLSTYCAQTACGKVDGHAIAVANPRAAAAWHVDAADGFAHPAIELGFQHLVPTVREQGIAMLAIVRSYNCGVVGHHVEKLARQGLLALAFANTPPAIAPWGGNRALFGTNPLAFAAPRSGGPPLVVDQSSSVVARGEVLRHARQGLSIPLGWALDDTGDPRKTRRRRCKDPCCPRASTRGPAWRYSSSCSQPR